MPIFGKNRAREEKPRDQRTGEDHTSQKRARQLSRRDILRAAAGATAVGAAEGAKLALQRKRQLGEFAAYQTARGIRNYVAAHQDVPLSDEDAESIPIDPNAPASVAVVGNSLAAGYQQADGQNLAIRSSRKISQRVQHPVAGISGAVPGSLPGDIITQYESIRPSIPPGNQHLVVQADDNAANVDPDAIENLAQLARNPNQPGRILNYIADRGRIRDQLEESLADSVGEIIDRGDGNIQSVRLVGPAPTHKARKIQELPDGKHPVYIPVEGDSTTALLTQAVLLDYEQGNMKATRDAARRIRKKKKTRTTVADIRNDVDPSDYADTDTQHYNNRGANKVAGKVADGYHRGNAR